jgi:hypothetical protein
VKELLAVYGFSKKWLKIPSIWWGDFLDTVFYMFREEGDLSLSLFMRIKNILRIK